MAVRNSGVDWRANWASAPASRSVYEFAATLDRGEWTEDVLYGAYVVT